MSDLQTLIEEIEVNQKAIAELETKALPHTERQHQFSVDAKKAREGGRECQAEIDKLLAPAQELRFANQGLKLKAGQLALNDRKDVH